MGGGSLRIPVSNWTRHVLVASLSAWRPSRQPCCRNQSVIVVMLVLGGRCRRRGGDGTRKRKAEVRVGGARTGSEGVRRAELLRVGQRGPETNRSDYTQDNTDTKHTPGPPGRPCHCVPNPSFYCCHSIEGSCVFVRFLCAECFHSCFVSYHVSHTLARPARQEDVVCVYECDCCRGVGSGTATAHVAIATIESTKSSSLHGTAMLWHATSALTASSLARGRRESSLVTAPSYESITWLKVKSTTWPPAHRARKRTGYERTLP